MLQLVTRSIRAAGCFNCRLLVLQAFAADSSISSRAAFDQSRNLWHSNHKQVHISSSYPQRATITSGGSEDAGSLLVEKKDGDETSNAEASKSAMVPWYLQVETPLKHPRPLLERQRIPDIPKFPPRILQPLLEQISIDLGLDNLSLLDLRDLDPPPALGANLIMIIGTARSEKHLHISADRLCRWLRSEYKLRPEADGLLGRNELKLKMRRKNRRAKLLGGGSSNDDSDDGLRTGWVCVNIGTVESAITSGRSQPQMEGFIGFGKQTEGVKIVVQMLVEEKREELNLENLWSGIAKRRLLAESELLEENTGAVEEQSDLAYNSSITSPLRLSGSNPSQTVTPFSPILIQSRCFHTGPRWLFPVMETIPSATPSAAPLFSKLDQLSNTDPASVRKQVFLLMESGEFDAACRLAMTNKSSVAEFQNNGWRLSLRDWLKSYINDVPRIQAFNELGKGFEDQSSTSFLRCFYQTISRFPSVSEWEAQIWIQCFARKLGHRGYTVEGLSKLFSDLQLSGATISNETYLKLLRSTLRPHGNSPRATPHRLETAQRDLAANILQDMYDRTGNILTEDVFLALQESLAFIPKIGSTPLDQLFTPPDAASTTCNLPVLQRSSVPNVQSRLSTLMPTLGIRIISDQCRIRLMNLYAKQYNWVDFWRVWRSVAREGEPRSAALWARMFQLVAETNHQKGCMSVLRTWIPDMDREEPQVRLEGEVLTAVKACLQVADPSVDIDMIYDPEVKGEWITLWRRCLGVL